MTSWRPTLPNIRSALADTLARGRRDLGEVAQALCVSGSTLQRSLVEYDTDFTALRREVQVQIALRHLTASRPVWMAAERAVLSPDHLRVLVKEATGLTPLQILTAARISVTLTRWRRKGPPAFGSWLYRHQFEQWQKFDTQLQDLLADLGPTHPLASWAKKTLLLAHRPDFRTRPYRDERRLQAERHAAQMQRLFEAAHLDLNTAAVPASTKGDPN